jgi:hypothetical protein
VAQASSLRYHDLPQAGPSGKSVPTGRRRGPRAPRPRARRTGSRRQATRDNERYCTCEPRRGVRSPSEGRSPGIESGNGWVSAQRANRSSPSIARRRTSGPLGREYRSGGTTDTRASPSSSFAKWVSFAGNGGGDCTRWAVAFSIVSKKRCAHTSVWGRWKRSSWFDPRGEAVQ